MIKELRRLTKTVPTAMSVMQPDLVSYTVGQPGRNGERDLVWIGIADRCTDSLFIRAGTDTAQKDMARHLRVILC